MSIKRLNYFKGEFLTQEDFREEQNYHVSMLREHNKNLHTGGIAAGLEVPKKYKKESKEIDVIGGTDIYIEKGMAVDDLGREIVLAEDKKIPISEIIPANPTKETFDLVIYCSEKNTDPREDNPGKLEDTRITEETVITSYELVISKNPEISSHLLKLAKVTFDTDSNDRYKIKDIDPTVRQYTSSIICNGAVGIEHFNSDIFNNLLYSPDGTVGVEADTSKQAIKLTSIIADKSVKSSKIDNGAVGREHFNSDIFNNLLYSPDGTVGVEADVSKQAIKLTSRVSTGLVKFSGFTPEVPNVSELVDPGLGDGSISVVLGLDYTNKGQIFIGTPEASRFFDLPEVLLGALVDVSNGKFKVGMSVKGKATSPILVRWWAFKSGLDVDTQEVVSVSIEPLSPVLEPGIKQEFSATVSGTENKEITWSVLEEKGGTIESNGLSGLYTAPPIAGIYHVIAKSVANPSKSATATINVIPIAVLIEPKIATLLVNEKKQFIATVTGTTNTEVTWSMQGTGVGAIDDKGFYTAPAVAGTYTVIATSKANPSKSATATVTIVPAITVSIKPKTATVEVNGKLQFSATLTGTTNTEVKWFAGVSEIAVEESEDIAVEDPSDPILIKDNFIKTVKPDMLPGNVAIPIGGVIDDKGLYTAPAIEGTYIVTATSKADPSKYDEAIITVVPAVAISIQPQTSSLEAGKGLQFNATVTGTTNKEIKWSVQETGGGSINTTGLYVAPNTAGTYHLIATSVADPSKSAIATVTVNLPISVSIKPKTATVEVNGKLQFSATLTGTTNTEVKWRAGVSEDMAVEDPLGPILIKNIFNETVKSDLLPGSVVISKQIDGVIDEGSATIFKPIGGAIDDKGLYTAPAIEGTYIVTATSKADSSKYDTAIVTVVPAVAISIRPQAPTVEVGNELEFFATVTGTSNTEVTWKIQEANGGTIMHLGSSADPVPNSCTYMSAGIPGTYHLIATSIADPNKFAMAAITVTRMKDLHENYEKFTDNKMEIIEKPTEKLKDADKIKDVIVDESISKINEIETIKEDSELSEGKAFIISEERPDVSIIRKIDK